MTNVGITEGQLDRKFQGKESILSSQISLHVIESKPMIPDGGWGWWVVFAAFMLNVISEGITLSFGFLYIEFLEEFGASASATAWIGSLFMAIPLLAGPLASALVDKYGCKWMTVVGGVTCMIGFVLSAFANSIGVMYFTFGIIGGLSRSLTYVTAVVAIAFWFEKKRTVALGLQGSGAGVGTVVFPPISTFLLDEYMWRGTLLVFAGFCANMCVCGMLMRDPEWIAEEEKRIKESKRLAKNGSNVAAKLLNEDETQALLVANHQNGAVDTKVKYFSVGNLPTYLKQDENVTNMYDKTDEKSSHNLIFTNYSDLPISTITTGENSVADSQRTNHASASATSSNAVDNVARKPTVVGHSDDNKIQNRHATYLKAIKLRKTSVGCHKALTIGAYKSKASSCPNVYRSCELALATKQEKWYDELLDILKDLANFSLFLELHFLLQSMSTIILFTWFIVPYFYLAEHMIRIGYTEEQASFVISIIGFTNTIGMVFLGLVGDRLNVAKTYAVCLILCGISVLSMMYFTANYVLLVINCALFGLFFASCFSLSPALLSTLVPLDGFTMAYGLGLLCEGIGNLIGPPLAGFIFDVTQSWEQSFYQAGFWIIISGLLVGTIAFTKNRKILGTGPLMKDEVHNRIKV